MKSQKDNILRYLKKGYSITSLEALSLFGCMSLPKRICEIQNMGYSIDKEFLTTYTGKRVRKYKLGEQHG